MKWEQAKLINALAVSPAMALLPAGMDTALARIILLAIGLQESNFLHRRQIDGPARGLWQFERGGGVAGVLRHHATAEHARQLCIARNVKPTPRAVYDMLEFDDVLAAGFARLLLWSDPAALPGSELGAWSLYMRTWRPGKPHPDQWPINYKAALKAMA